MYFRQKGGEHIFSNKDIAQFFEADDSETDLVEFKKGFEKLTRIGNEWIVIEEDQPQVIGTANKKTNP